MSETQVDINKVIESLLRQVAEYAQKVAMLDALVSVLETKASNDD